MAAPMRPCKLDFMVTEVHSSSVQVATGIKIAFKQASSTGDDVVCTSEFGDVLGLVPRQARSELPRNCSGLFGAVRSVRRDPLTSACLEFVVRVSWAQSTQQEEPPPLLLLPEEEHDIETELAFAGFLLKKSQLEKLVHHDPLIPMLMDERLQAKLIDIDSARNREKALVMALKDPNFQQFADKLLAVVTPDLS